MNPWGSGETESTRNKGFLDYIDEMRSQGLSQVEIAKGLGYFTGDEGVSTTALRAAISIAKNEQLMSRIVQAEQLKAKGYSNVAIGERMGINESVVRSLLAPGKKERTEVLMATSNMLKESVDKNGEFIQIGSGVEQHLGITNTKLSSAVAVLQEQGYAVHTIQELQLGTGLKTNIKVLCPPGTSYRDVVMNKEKIQMTQKFSNDDGYTFLGIVPPLSIDSSRVAIKYAEQGGSDSDGLIHVRPGVSDVSLGGKQYAQVRVAVDGTHYLKGMAVYKNDLPDGVDLVFNTNKSDTGNKHDAMKSLKDDPDNPFGASIKRQILTLDSSGKEKPTSVMNLVNEEGDWEKWSRSLSAQALSKQSRTLAKEQLDKRYEAKKKEYDEIMALTNPSVRKRLLESFSEDVDASAIHLSAAALPRSSWHALLPVPEMKDTEIYAPNFRNGERVALIRYPHAGRFEIPELTVNNNHKIAKSVLGRAQDAVGISSNVAKHLSGADFDGDAVLVIPNNNKSIKISPALEGLKNFDPTIYKVHRGPDDPPTISARTKQTEMGIVSNLITDMTIRGATDTELAAAVRHSMVVIDSEKHNLDYKLSAKNNGIKHLKEKYQLQPDGTSGASTIVSRAGSEQRVPNRKLKGIDPKTGKKIYEETGESYTRTTVNKRTGEVKTKTVVRKFPSVKLAETEDAHTLSSGMPIEKIYADHSNRLKALANESRKAMVNTKPLPKSPSAASVYANEVASLNAKLNVAKRNRPLERQALLFANATVKAKQQDNPNMLPEDLKKIKAQALERARSRTQAKKQSIKFTDREWEAVQAGALSPSKLNEILLNANLDLVKKLATPKQQTVMTSTKTAQAQRLLSSGYTQAEVADKLGVSLSTLKTTLKEG